MFYPRAVAAYRKKNYRILAFNSMHLVYVSIRDLLIFRFCHYDFPAFNMKPRHTGG